MSLKKRTPIIRKEIDVIDADPNIGLSSQEVTAREEGGWVNGLTISASRTEGQIIAHNCFTFFNLVFVVLAVIVALGGSSIKNMTFLVIVICNTVIGCFQEIRAKRAVDKLTLVAAQQLRVCRDGTLQILRSDLLVRDDIVEFVSGDQICADGILRTGQLQVNEALITGEEDPVVKNPGDALRSGSFVIAGTGRVQLTRVGRDSYAARLAAEAKANPTVAKSEMMNALDKLIRVVGFALIPIGFILFYQEFRVLNLGLRTSVEGTVSALVGMIPEGLYLLTSIAMAASALKLSQQRVLVQDMNCIETLARVDVLCVDKTGTITENVMEVENVLPLTEDPPEYLEKVLCAVYSQEEPENQTAAALAEMFSGKTDWVCTHRVPFTSETKYSISIFAGQGAFVIGAPEFIMGEHYGSLRAQVEELSAKGFRVLLVARHPVQPDDAIDPRLLEPLALITLTNRIRPSAPKTFAYFAEQGVAVKVISGDNPITVSQVAMRAGIPNADHYVDVSALESDEDFENAVKHCSVFGRVTPDRKKRLIQAFQAQGHTVAMTGDGVNDVLAMKQANCGIAMSSGAQAASQVAQLVLLDSDFSAMPGIVGEGRRVINNIQRAATLFLVKNIFSMGLALISLLTGWAYPLIPLHLSVISSLTIGVPSFFLAMEPNYERVNGRFLPTVLRRAFPGGVTNIIMVLLAQAFMVHFGLPLAQISTVCTALLATTGLLVLFQVSYPMGFFRKLVFFAMAVALVFCFTLLGGFFELHPTGGQASLVLISLMLATPVVFLALQWLFIQADKLRRHLRK